MYWLSVKQFKDLIKDQGSKAAVFYLGEEEIDFTANKVRPLRLLTGSNPQDLIKQIEAFAKIFPVKFTAFVHSVKEGISSKGYKMNVDLSDIEITLPATTNPGHTPNESVKDIETRVRNEIKLTSESELVKVQLQHANAKLDQLDNAADKIALILLSFVEKLATPSPALQGTSEEQTEGDISIEDAVQQLRESFGDKTLIILAGKIQADDTLPGKMKILLGL